MTWEALAALAAVAAAFAAAWQLHSIRTDARTRRAAEINSVSIVTTVVIRPRPSDVVDGRALWIYDYGLDNPGALPISNVEVRITYPCDVQREHEDGVRDPITREETFHVPVVAPRTIHRPRRRVLLIKENDWPGLEKTEIVITFLTPDAGSCATRWPKPTGFKIDKKLLALVGRS